MVTLTSVHSFSVNQDYRLLDDGEEISPTTERALQALGITHNDLEAIPAKPLNDIVAIELSCSRYMRWAAIDHVAEKVLQGLVMSRSDVDPKAYRCSDQIVRFMPHGRSILLHSQCGLRKEAAVRGFVHTTEQVLLVSVKLFIMIALGFRLYEFAHKGTFDSSEFQSLFQANDHKGVLSLVRFLARFDKTWLQLLLASPALIGAMKALWEGCQSRPLSQDDLLKLQADIARHSRPLKGCLDTTSAYVWSDNLRQLIAIPGFANVSGRLQKAERNIRSDGGISVQERRELFKAVQQISLEGHGLTRLNAMQSLAKIVHSLSMKDLATMQAAGYPKEVLQQILEIKAQALQALRMLSARVPSIQVKHSLVSTIYASYLLWWLGMGNIKARVVFGIFKTSKTMLEVLFLKEVIESILEAIRCPDKPGFRMFYGDYEVWANELTVACFNEFIRQFRLIFEKEKIQPFLEQLKNFHLESVDTLDLSLKSLTTNETQAILKILIPKMNLKHLILKNNLIGRNAGRIDFPPSLLSLDLSGNRIGDEMAARLQLPTTLQSLDLNYNQIGSDGAAKLQLPLSLQTLFLGSNHIGPSGAAKLQLPSSLQTLYLLGNQIGPDGAAKLQLPSSLQELDLASNQIGKGGAAQLQLPTSLRSLNLYGNLIGPEGAAKLQLPPSLLLLDLDSNQIGDDGAAKLQLPPFLLSLYLTYNQIGPDGVAKLQLPPSLRMLFLGSNHIGPSGAAKLQLPSSLLYLDVRFNLIGDDGVAKLQLPSYLRTLFLGQNQIGSDGAAKLQLPSFLQELYLWDNQIGSEGAAKLQLPAALQILDLRGNQIGPDGAVKLQLPTSLHELYLQDNQIGPDGVAKLQLPSSLQRLDLSFNQIGSDGAAKLQLPSSLQYLNLWSNHIGPDGAAKLQLPSSLQWLYLSYNQISDDGAARLQLPAFLQGLDLKVNQIGPDGAAKLQLPSSLRTLFLGQNQIGPDGAAMLQLPSSLLYLNLESNEIGDNGAIRLHLPTTLQTLDVRSNTIGDAGVKALLQKVPQTNLTYVYLDGNKYNTSILDARVALQRAALLRRCQDKLCHANTPLHDNLLVYEPQTSSASRSATPFFSWLNRPLKVVANRVNACVTTILHRVDAGFTSALNSMASSLRSALSDSPAYFPNLRSPYFYDHVPLAGHHTLAMAGPGANALVLPAFLAYHHMPYIRA